ncbi:MAG: tRNA (N6-isopentenyl adenosine(37)-C2)-methylthiotransferase MiaB [Alphaproteobacteria bacterium]|nr:tRNA (N6-isopentenyl adenosine(37)-C2)-methylthiotransferase MiaB [Alphaproteobacteria bacterium]
MSRDPSIDAPGPAASSPAASSPAASSPATRRVHIRTFGCQMNAYDTGKLKALLAEDGFEPTEDMADADLIVVNTCSIRDKPEQKLHSFLGEARHVRRARQAQGGDVMLAVAGCVAQQEGAKLQRRYKDLDLVFGPDAVTRVRELVKRAEHERVLDTDFIDADDYVFADQVDPDADASPTAFVTIQKGCDNKCTFCIVPTTRGGELSRPSAQILEEVRALTARGVKEITLIGQNVNSYGLKVAGERTFAQLLYAVAELPGVERIRYTTSHPRDMGPDVVQAYRDLPQLTSHLHLPVQSGSDAVLRRMKRFYTRERYLRLVDELRAARPDLALSTDFIVGFPGESDADFEDTMDLLGAVGFHTSFSFRYSPRPGTPALKLIDRGDEVPADVASARLQRLQARQRTLARAAMDAMVGTVQQVLVEGWSRNDPGVICGRTGTFKTINFPGDVALVGATVPVRVTTAYTNSLKGEAVA